MRLLGDFEICLDETRLQAVIQSLPMSQLGRSEQVLDPIFARILVSAPTLRTGAHPTSVPSVVYYPCQFELITYNQPYFNLNVFLI